ncbi:MAG: hypothetical protein PVG45_03380 [Gammaproteobacteria bacterium]|jgi:hypothetical protein
MVNVVIINTIKSIEYSITMHLSTTGYVPIEQPLVISGFMVINIRSVQDTRELESPS